VCRTVWRTCAKGQECSQAEGQGDVDLQADVAGARLAKGVIAPDGAVVSAGRGDHGHKVGAPAMESR
jgi:hypothetical protein